MTYGQLFMTLNPNVKVVENGTCVWIYFDSVNRDTFRAEWWNKEIPDEALKAQETAVPLDKLCEWLAKNASWYATEIDGDTEEWKSILAEWMEEQNATD